MKDSCMAIYSGAFEECTNLEMVKLPDTVLYIGRRAFDNCKKLRNINIPRSCTIIDEMAFSFCESLTEIALPNSLKYIKSHAFSHSGLKHIIIPDSVKGTGAGSFSVCADLMKVVIECDVENIAADGFVYCKFLKSIDLPDAEGSSFSSVDDVVYKGSFENGDAQLWILPSGKKTISIPDGTVSIKNLFKNRNKSLERVYIPECVRFSEDDRNEIRFNNALYHFLFTDPTYAFTIYCHRGSEAEKFAWEHDLKYEIF